MDIKFVSHNEAGNVVINGDLIVFIAINLELSQILIVFCEKLVQKA
jgi:hypothetical protein